MTKLVKMIGKASPTTSISDVGEGLASVYAERMAQRVARDAMLSDEQRATLKREEKPGDGTS